MISRLVVAACMLMMLQGCALTLIGLAAYKANKNWEKRQEHEEPLKPNEYELD